MDWITLAVIAAATFLACFLLDKSLQKLFRNTAQHKSGLSVRLNKKFGAFGLIFAVLGIGAMLTGWGNTWTLTVCGGILILVGLGLAVYYLSFGLFYDDDSFLFTAFGRKGKVYTYSQIRSQQLFNSYGSILIELTMEDGQTIPLQAGMSGVYPFLDKAFIRWCAQKGICPEDCDFYDPQNSCWFPGEEDI